MDRGKNRTYRASSDGMGIFAERKYEFTSSQTSASRYYARHDCGF
jgi:hypothetical protein